MGLVGDACRDGLHQARLTDAGVAGDQHDLALTIDDGLPAVQQQPELLVAPDERRQAAAVARVQAIAHAALGAHPEDVHRLGEALQRVCAGVLGDEEALHQALACRADHQPVLFRQPLQARGQVRRLAQGELLPPLSAPYRSDDNQAGMHADAHRQRNLQLRHQPRAQLADRRDDAQPGAHRALGVVFMRLGMAEVHHQSIAEKLGDMALVAFDDRRAGRLIGADHLPQVFGIEPSGQRSRAREVAEHDGDLPALAVGPLLGLFRVVGGSRLAHHPARRAGQARQPLAAAAAEHVVGLVEEGAARAGQRQRLAAGRAESAVGAVIDAAGRTFHVEACRMGQPAGQGRCMVRSVAGPVQPRRLAQV